MEDERFDFYANSVQVVSGIYDVTLHFRTETPVVVKEGQKPMIEAAGICNVRMSPQHAKALAVLMVKHIQQYEEQNKVVLPIPEPIGAIWKEYVEKIVGEAKE